ncbi:MAG: type IV pilus modification PilV family protein [Planctomycetota bacterium]|jgi:MSHA pilin protein MshD
MSRHTATARSGITLLETLLAAIVLAMAAGAIVMPFTAGARCAEHDARLTVAVGLAQDIMEEVLSKPFADPDGGDGQEASRANYDDLDDYDGHEEPPGGISSFDGGAVSEVTATGMSRHVTVEDVYVSGQDTGEPATFKRVTVEVRHQGRALTTLCRLVYADDP